MSEREPIATHAADAAITAAILNTGRTFALASGAILLLVLTLWLLKHPLNSAMVVSTLISALVQTYFAWRVGFDASLFRIWASRWQTATDVEDDLRAFDAGVGRQRPATTSLDADLAARRSGTIRLLFLQVLAGLLQALFAALAIWNA